MKTGLFWILWGVAIIIFGLVTIWPWPLGSAWSSWVCVGEGIVMILVGVGLVNIEKKRDRKNGL